MNEPWLIAAISLLFTILAYLVGKARAEGKQEQVIAGLLTREEFRLQQGLQRDEIRKEYREYMQQRLEDLNLIGGGD